MTHAGFETTFSAGKSSQNFVLDSAVIRVDKDVFNLTYLTQWGVPICLWAKYGHIYSDCGEILPTAVHVADFIPKITCHSLWTRTAIPIWGCLYYVDVNNLLT